MTVPRPCPLSHATAASRVLEFWSMHISRERPIRRQVGFQKTEGFGRRSGRSPIYARRCAELAPTGVCGSELGLLGLARYFSRQSAGSSRRMLGSSFAPTMRTRAYSTVITRSCSESVMFFLPLTLANVRQDFGTMLRLTVKRAVAGVWLRLIAIGVTSFCAWYRTLVFFPASAGRPRGSIGRGAKKRSSRSQLGLCSPLG
jgi:hypothetical protein